MRITNKNNVPDALVRAVQNDPYTKGDADYSVSDLITPPRVLWLKKKYWNQLEEDVEDRIWSLFGQAMHHIAERANVKDLAEERFSYTVLGKKISGGTDNIYLHGGVLSDYKVSTVSKFTFADFTDWEQQQNCYVQLLRWHKIAVIRAEIVALTRDYRPKEAETAKKENKPYPQKCFTIELPIWSEARAIAFIEDRVRMHEEAKVMLPECNARERWARPDTWAVKRFKQKYAVSGHSNYATEVSAKRAAIMLGDGHYAEKRTHRNMRCEGYCAPAKFCDQFERIKRASTDA